MEFVARGWPLDQWGIFSLALTHRTGRNCEAYARSQDLTWDSSETPLSATLACLAHHQAQVQGIWTSSKAQEAIAKVDAWLAEPSIPGSRGTHVTPYTAGHQGHSGALPPSTGPSTGPGSGISKWRRPGIHSWTTPSATPVQQQGVASSGPSSKEKENQQQRTPAPVPKFQASPGAGLVKPQQQQQVQQVQKANKLSLIGKKRAEPEPQTLVPLAPLAAGPKPQPTALGAIKPAAAVTQNKGSKPLGKKKEKVVIQRNLDDSDDDDFIPGSLKPLASKPAWPPALPQPSSSIAPAKAKQKPAARPRRVKAGMYLASNASLAGAGSDELSSLGGLERINVIRLDKEVDRLPGWARPVTPYTPLPVRQQRPSGTVVECEDILKFDLASLGSGFAGVIVNAPLVDSATPGGGSGLTSTQLASIQMDLAAAPNAIVCCWAVKGQVGEVLRCLNSWGCKYAENLTWVEMDPNGHLASGPSSYTQCAHKTLVMALRGTGKGLELRHQRTCDVLMAPSPGGGRFPDEVRVMMETLLPPAAPDGEGGPRFLEIAFHGAEVGGRAGWVTLVQKSR